MKTLSFIPFIIGIIVLFMASSSLYKIEPKEIPSVRFENEMKLINGRYLYKIFYEGHSYIFLRNTWSSAGDNIIHDPGCKCNKKELK